MLDWLHDLPAPLGALLVCLAFVIPTLLGSYLLQPAVARLFRGEKDVNTVLGFLLNAFALYFGVLLALLSIAVFENHNKAEDAVQREAASIVKLYRDFNAYPEPARSELAAILHRYVDEVIGPGWALQAKGEINLAEIAIMNELQARVAAFDPADNKLSLRYAQTLTSLDDFVESRRLRIGASSSSIPQVMWVVVLIGAVMNALLIWMFDLRAFSHAIIGGSLSTFIGLVIYMVAALDAPFRGVHAVTPDAIISVHEQSGMREIPGSADPAR